MNDGVADLAALFSSLYPLPLPYYFLYSPIPWMHPTALRAERDQLQAQLQAQLQPAPQSSPQIEQLQADNHQLKNQLLQTQATLDQIRLSLGLANEAAPKAAAAEPELTPVAISSPNRSLLPIAVAEPIAQPTTTPPKARRDAAESTAKIHQIIDAILSWNSAQEDSESMLRVSIPVIKAIGKPMGATYQQAIQQTLKERETELESFHRQHLLGVRHNASVVDRSQILQRIARDYLGLEDWQIEG